MKMSYFGMLPGLLSRLPSAAPLTSGLNTEKSSPLKSKLTKIIKESIDDSTVVGLVLPLLLSLSDDELRQYLVKVGTIIDEVLLDDAPHSSEFPCSADPCRHVVIENSDDRAGKAVQAKKRKR